VWARTDICNLFAIDVSSNQTLKGPGEADRANGCIPRSLVQQFSCARPRQSSTGGSFSFLPPQRFTDRSLGQAERQDGPVVPTAMTTLSRKAGCGRPAGDIDVTRSMQCIPLLLVTTTRGPRRCVEVGALEVPGCGIISVNQTAGLPFRYFETCGRIDFPGGIPYLHDANDEQIRDRTWQNQRRSRFG